jgi:hypothetical protein
MASNGKTKMAFKQRALMFTSRGELSTQALQNVLASRQATPTRRDALVSDGARSSGKGGPSSGASSSKVASSTNAGGGCDSDCIEVLNVSDLPESVDVGGAVEGVKKRKRTEPKRRYVALKPLFEHCSCWFSCLDVVASLTLVAFHHSVTCTVTTGEQHCKVFLFLNFLYISQLSLHEFICMVNSFLQ